MKKSVLFFLLGIFPNLITAQNKGDFIIIPFIGINNVAVSGDGIDSIMQSIEDYIEEQQSAGASSFGGIYSRQGINVGFLLNYYFVDKIAFSTGVSYSQRGYIIQRSWEYTTGFDFKYDQEKRVNINYFDWPFLLRYHFANGIELFGGPLFSFMESNKVITEETKIFETRDSISGNVITVTEFNGESNDYDDTMSNHPPNKLVSGLQLGVSFVLKRLDISFKYNKASSFGKIGDQRNNRNITWQLCAGIHF